MPGDRDQFLEKLIVKAALPPGREFGYLWSRGRRDDTGFGKTRLMLWTARTLNADLGRRIWSTIGLPEGPSIAGVWASMKTTGITSIYALLFNTIIFALKRPSADEKSLIEKCWDIIARREGVESEDTGTLSAVVVSELQRTRRELFPGYPTLRWDVVNALASCDRDEAIAALEAVSQAGRTRNGLSYFEAFYCLVRCAEIEHLFVFIDQLEDLAMAKNVPRATRQREVGRFRDIFAETAGFRGHCHAVFTFHNRAAQELADFWHLERINPPFWPQDPMGRPATVVLRGLKTPDQVERLLAMYLDSVRETQTGTADPFDPSTFEVLLKRCDGRIGQLLPEAYAVLEQAADEGLPSISAEFIQKNLPVTPDLDIRTEEVSDQDDTLVALWNRNP
jgi:hypothetical protein